MAATELSNMYMTYPTFLGLAGAAIAFNQYCTSVQVDKAQVEITKDIIRLESELKRDVADLRRELTDINGKLDLLITQKKGK
jgi:hypothetical protein